MEALEKRVTELIQPILDEEGFELIRVRITGARSKTLQVMAERPDGSMSAEDCAALSRAISPVIEAADPIEDRWTLEVSSPGIDRPLTRLKDFAAWEGYEAKLELDRMVEGQKRFRGVLGGVEDDNVVLDIEGEEEAALIPFSWISQAKLVLSDELLRDSLRRSKEAGRLDDDIETEDYETEEDDE